MTYYFGSDNLDSTQKFEDAEEAIKVFRKAISDGEDYACLEWLAPIPGKTEGTND